MNRTTLLVALLSLSAIRASSAAAPPTMRVDY